MRTKKLFRAPTSATAVAIEVGDGERAGQDGAEIPSPLEGPIAAAHEHPNRAHAAALKVASALGCHFELVAARPPTRRHLVSKRSSRHSTG